MTDMFSKSFTQSKREWKNIGKLYVSPVVVEDGNEFDSCLGFYDPGKKVMVKRRKLSPDNNEKTERECSILKDWEEHENILNWVTLDKDDDFSYMLEERWSFTLETLVKYFRSTKTTTPLLRPKPRDEYINNMNMNLQEDIVPLMLKLMENVAKGLNHLHEMDFVHRDLNPKNVVIVCGSKSMTAKIANFCTTECRSIIKPNSKIKTISHDSTGFQPLEQITNNRTRKYGGKVQTPETSTVDLFSFGCILFYSLTLGEHPFGASLGARPGVIEASISPKNLKLNRCTNEEAKILLTTLLDFTPISRETVTYVLHAPVFWSFEKKLDFFKDASEIMEKKGAVGRIIAKLVDAQNQDVFGLATDWGRLLDPLLLTHITDPANPYCIIDPVNPTTRAVFSKVCRLVRLIRNQHSHFLQLPPNIKVLYKGTVQGLEEYYRLTFPRLLATVYTAVLVNKHLVDAEFVGYITKYFA